MFAMPDDTRARLTRQSRACYEAHLTRRQFWSRHAALYEAAASLEPVTRA